MLLEDCRGAGLIKRACNGLGWIILRVMSALSSFFERRWKLIVNLITVLALAVLVYAIRDQLAETLRNLHHVNLWYVLLIIPIEAVGYDAQTRLYRRLFGIAGNKLSYRFLLETSLELNMVNHVFPSGGVTGFSYFGLRLKNGEELTAAKATLVQVMKLVLLFLSFEILLVLGLFFLAIEGKANELVIFITGSLSTLLIVGTAGVAYVIGSQRRINSFLTAVTKFLNRLIQIVRPRSPETIRIASARKVFDDLHQNFVLFRRHQRELRAPFAYALLINVTEILAIYAVYIAFGEWVNVGAVILAYAVANFAGLVSVLPGGVGIYEGLMTAVLSAGGVPAAVSLPVTVVYRVVNTLVQLPPGFVLYLRAIAGKGAKA